jgi:hypothetical protein
MADVSDLEQQIIRERARLEEYWSPRNSLIDEMRAIRFMENVPDVPADLMADVVQTPIGYQIVERMVGALFADDYQITVPRPGEGDTAEQRASKLEKFTHGALGELERLQDEDVLERFGECLLADGHGCMRLLHAPQFWKGYPRRDRKGEEEDSAYNKRTEDWKRGRRLPFAWQWLEPDTVYPLWGETGLHAIMEVTERDPLSLAKDRYNRVKEDPDLWDLALKPTGDGEVKFIQRWIGGELTYMVNNTVVHSQTTKYERPPYVYAFGSSVSRRNAEYAGLSTLYPMRYLLPYLDRLLSQKATAIRLWAWPTPIVKTIANRPLGADGLPVPEDIEPGKSVTLFPGEDITFLVWNGTGPDIDKMTQFIYSMTERAGISDVLYGQGGSGDSGYLISQLLSAARMKFRPIVRHTERAMTQVIQLMWDLIENVVGQNVYVHADGEWLGLGPDDLNGYRQVHFTLNPLLPTDEYARSSMTINEVKAGLRSERSGREEIGIAQPDEEERQILIEGWKKRPEVQNWLTQQALKRANMLLMEQQMMTQQAMQAAMPQLPPALQQALASRGMQPPMPGQGIEAAPGVAAIPQAPGDRVMQPAGVASGQAPGVQMTGPGGV